MPITLASNSPQEVKSSMAVLQQHLRNLTAVLACFGAAAANPQHFLHVHAAFTVHNLL